MAMGPPLNPSNLSASLTNSSCVIVWVREVLKRTVVGD